jgi:hypothetical protein
LVRSGQGCGARVARTASIFPEADR